jgi:hypothetical protein
LTTWWQLLLFGYIAGQPVAAALSFLWFDELRVEVFPRAIVLSGTWPLPFQTIAGYDLRRFQDCELTLEYVPQGRLWANKHVTIRVPPELRGRFAALLAERCPTATRRGRGPSAERVGPWAAGTAARPASAPVSERPGVSRPA